MALDGNRAHNGAKVRSNEKSCANSKKHHIDAKGQGRVFIAQWLKKETSATVLSAKPVSMNCVCPYLSANLPLRGPTAKNAISNGKIRNPACKGLRLSTSWN